MMTQFSSLYTVAAVSFPIFHPPGAQVKFKGCIGKTKSVQARKQADACRHDREGKMQATG